MKKISFIFMMALSVLVLSNCNKSYNGESPSTTAYSTEKGIEGVVMKEGNNEWFIIKTSDQYVVIEAQGMNNFNVDDVVYGDFRGFQGRKIYNSTTKTTYTAWVEGYFSNYSDAVGYMESND